MDPLIVLPLIMFCAVAVIDMSGVIDSIDSLLSKFIGTKAHVPKPFSCSLCMTHWTGLIWLICTGKLTLLLYAWLLLLSLLTSVVADLTRFFIEACQALVAFLFKMLKNIR